MKLLLDENIPHGMRALLLPSHQVFTVAYLDWSGISNGKLLSLAASQGFDAVITTDRGLEWEQNTRQSSMCRDLIAGWQHKARRPSPPRPSIAGGCCYARSATIGKTTAQLSAKSL